MLRLALRLLAVPVLALLVGTMWMHGFDGHPAPPAGGPRSRPPLARGTPPAAAAAQPAAPSPSSGAGPPALDGGDMGRLASGLWRRLNAEVRTTATGEYSMLRELSDAIRNQMERLARPSSASP